ncbi:MAG: hypothetical protein WCF98_10460 [Synechococcus sp. ELA057]
MAEKRSARPEAPEATAQDPSHAAAAEPVASEGPMPEWLAEAVQQGLRPEQLLACIGLGWMGRMGGDPQRGPWVWEAENEGGQADLAALRQRLELIRLAIETGAPLSTAEVSQLLGARPGAELVERGGLRARRMGRNVWKLSRAGESREGSGAVVAFSEGFRRRL